MKRAALLAACLAAATTCAPAQDSVLVITGKPDWRDRQAAGSRSVLGGAEWRALGMPDLSGTLATLPGVQPNRGDPGQSLPTVRGIGTVTSGPLLGTQQATTGVYLEDVPLTSPFGFVGTPDFTGFELARLDVLRGPQGVLYGAASLGGALNVVLAPPRPGVDGAMGRASWRVPRHGQPGWALGAALERALGPTRSTALRLEGFAEHTGGVTDNLGTGQPDADRARRQGVRLAAQLSLAPQAALNIHLLHQAGRLDDNAAVAPGTETSARTSDAPSASWRRQRLGLARIELAAELAPDLALSAVGAWVDQQVESGLDFTASLGPVGSLLGPGLGLGPLPALPLVRTATLEPTRSRALSQEVRLVSTPAGGVQWLAGLFVQHTRFGSRNQTLAPGGAALWGPAGALLPGDELASLDLAARSREEALFGEAAWPLGDTLRLAAGARAYRARLDYRGTLRTPGSTASGAPAAADRGVLPRISLQHDGRGWGAYALLSRGYRVGGVNLDPPAFTRYRPDRLLNQEIGLRLGPADGLRAELALYRMDWRDAQVSALVVEPVPLIGVANVGQARSQGLEAALQAPLGANTRAGLRLAWTDAATRAPFTTAAGVPVAAGAQLPGTPRRQLAAELTHALALPAGWAGQARLDVTARSRSAEALGSTASTAGHALLGLGLAAQRGPWQWQLRLDNAGDAAPVAGAEVVERPGLPTLSYRYLAEPRRWSLQLRHEH